MIRKLPLLSLLSVLMLAGCFGGATKPSSFYVLSVTETGALPGAADRNLALGLGPVALPTMVDRPQMVTRPDANRLELSEFHRWGSDLNRDLTAVMAQNLMNLLATDHVPLHPWRTLRKPELEVAIRFFRLDGTLGGSAQIHGVWSITDSKAACELKSSRFQIEEPAAGQDHGALVAAMSKGIGRLSREIATAALSARQGCE